MAQESYRRRPRPRQNGRNRNTGPTNDRGGRDSNSSKLKRQEQRRDKREVNREDKGNPPGRKGITYCSYCGELNHHYNACIQRTRDQEDDVPMESPAKSSVPNVLANYSDLISGPSNLPRDLILINNVPLAIAIQMAAKIKADNARDCDPRKLLEDAHGLEDWIGLPLNEALKQLGENAGYPERVLTAWQNHVYDYATQALTLLKELETPKHILEMCTLEKIGNIYFDICRETMWNLGAIQEYMFGVLAAIALGVQTSDDSDPSLVVDQLRVRRRPAYEDIRDFVPRIRVGVQSLATRHEADFAWALGVYVKQQFDTNNATLAAPSYLQESFTEDFGLEPAQATLVLNSENFKRDSAIKTYKKHLILYIYPLTQYAVKDPSTLIQRWTLHRKKMAHGFAEAASWNIKTVDKMIMEKIYEDYGIKEEAAKRMLVELGGGYPDIWALLNNGEVDPGTEWYV